jgi:hypothetical protein
MEIVHAEIKQPPFYENISMLHVRLYFENGDTGYGLLSLHKDNHEWILIPQDAKRYGITSDEVVNHPSIKDELILIKLGKKKTIIERAELYPKPFKRKDIQYWHVNCFLESGDKVMITLQKKPNVDEWEISDSHKSYPFESTDLTHHPDIRLELLFI